MSIRITSSSRSRDDDNSSVTIEGLTNEQVEIFEGFVRGAYWLNIDKGGLNKLFALEQPPAPAEDETMMPYWLPQDKRKNVIQTKLFVDQDEWPPFSPTFIIQHLCGYSYSKENYKSNAEILEIFGFECLRSRRGVDGKFWEIWLLSSLVFAKGLLREKVDEWENELKEINRQHKDKIIIQKVVEFLCKNVSFEHLMLLLKEQQW